jgi:alkanesulfonate monooxygenase SsuD/methylene tetrahydromethanopterin reductase-like flavin-dependent oxidoreductase (luciferase family)
MRVFLFDLLAYDQHFEDAKAERFLPYPLPGSRFDPEVAARTYDEHFEIWDEMERLGYDGLGLNEHHTTPHGLMNSPNMFAAIAAQRTKKMKLFMLGNLLPLHTPLRIAEELAVVDCLSRGRVMAGFARGVPREYRVYNVPMSESRARFEEGMEIVLGAWTQDVFNYEGKFWQHRDISIWPRPFQQPHPPIWIPFTGSKETIEWAGRHNFNGVIAATHRGIVEDVVGLYARSLASHGHQITPDHLCMLVEAYVAPTLQQAREEFSPYYLYFNQTLWHHGSLPSATPAAGPPGGDQQGASFDYVRPENLPHAAMDRTKIRNMTQPDIDAKLASGDYAWGPAKEVAERLIDRAEVAGSNNLLVSLNQGAMPNSMFMEQVRRFGREVLPILQAHEVKRVPLRTAA